jgi:hypothetical protein
VTHQKSVMNDTKPFTVVDDRSTTQLAEYERKVFEETNFRTDQEVSHANQLKMRNLEDVFSFLQESQKKPLDDHENDEFIKPIKIASPLI